MNIRTASFWITALALSGLAGCQSDKRDFMVGTLERDRVELVVESNEPIIDIPASDGQKVAVGDLVLVQDPARHRNRLNQQLALRDQAGARLAELQRGPREERIREARAQLAGAMARTVNAKQEYDRARELFDQGVGQQSSVDRTIARWQETQALEKANRETLDRLLNGTTTEELMQAEAALQAAEEAVGQARLDRQRLEVRASVAGTLDRIWFQVGERPAPGATVAVVLDDSRPFARIYVPAHQRAVIQPGARLMVALEGHDGELEGTVSWVSSDATFTPYFALTEHDRSRLSYLAEVELPQAADLPSGLPLEAWRK